MSYPAVSRKQAFAAYACLVALCVGGVLMLLRPDVNASSLSRKSAGVWIITHTVPQQGSNSYRVFRSEFEPSRVGDAILFFTDMDTGNAVLLSPPYVAEETR